MNSSLKPKRKLPTATRHHLVNFFTSVLVLQLGLSEVTELTFIRRKWGELAICSFLTGVQDSGLA